MVTGTVAKIMNEHHVSKQRVCVGWMVRHGNKVLLNSARYFSLSDCH